MGLVRKSEASAEAQAKALLLQYLLEIGEIDSRSAVATELGIAKQTNRADVAVIREGLSVFEIKTQRDTLKRLESQIKAYESVAETVTLVVASNHISAIISRTPDYVGILEMVPFEGTNPIRLIRPAKRSPKWNIDACLALLPASEIRARLLPSNSPRRRAEIVAEVAKLPTENQIAAVMQFLHDRYRPSTLCFLKSIRNKIVKPSHVKKLHIWSKNTRTSSSEFNNLSEDEYLKHVGKSFGPVPDEVKALIEG